MSRFLAVARERVFSPGKIEADRGILEAVAEALRCRGHRVDVASAEDRLPSPAPSTVVFTMSQGEEALGIVREWESRGVRVINSVESILNCHRHRMLDCFRRSGVATPETLLLADHARPAWPSWLAAGGWLKRGDVHATEAGDVVFVVDEKAAAAGLQRLRRRGIERVVLQRHVPGVVVKFYAVANGFLAWYPPPETRLELSPEQVAALRAVGAEGARALGLEVYGGDCVVDVNGGLQLIDLNDWPSYAPCRLEAAGAIAAHLEAQSESSDP